MRDDFSTLDIEKALGIPLEKLRGWLKKGFVSPSTPSAGQGKRAVFTRADLYAISLVERLISSGVRGFFAGDMASRPFSHPNAEIAHFIFLGGKIVQSSIYPRGKEQEFFDDLKKLPFVYEFILSVNLDSIRAQVDEALKNLE